jgi:hypothetical protein
VARSRMGVLALAVCTASPALAWQAADGGTADGSEGLIGRWQLNKAESEDARAKMAEARQRSGGGSGGSGGMGGGHHGGGGYGGGGGGYGGGGYGGHRGGGGGSHGGYGGGREGDGSGGDHSASAGSPGSMHELLEPADQLTITGSPSEVTLDDGNGELTRLVVDGKAHPRESGGGETTARWRGNSLEVVSKSERGFSVTTTYTPNTEAHKLEVLAKISGRGDPVSVKRVYDVAPPT